MKIIAKTLSAVAFFGGLAVLHADTAPEGASPPATLSVVEMSTRVAGIDSQIQDDYRRVLQLKEQAKKLKDVIKLSCVNDKLVQLKAQMNIADSTHEELQAAMTQDTQERQPLFTTFAASGDSIMRLREEASACIGEPELYKQESGVVVEHPEIPDDPNAIDPFETEVEPPAYASPYR